MENTNKKFIGEAAMKSQPAKKLQFFLKDESVTTDKLHKESVTKEKLHPEVMEELNAVIDKKVEDLQHQIDSLEIHGIAVSKELGKDNYIGISQKRITEELHKLWNKIFDITGESAYGITMTINPPYFFGDSKEVTIKATSDPSYGLFEHIVFYANDEEVYRSTEPMETVEFNITLHDTTTIRCEAKVQGDDFVASGTITQYAEYWIGGATDYTDIINLDHKIDVTPNLVGAWDITFHEDDYLFIVMGKDMAESFRRADINGMEIQWDDEYPQEIDGYMVWKSADTFNEGTLNIDING